MLIVNWGMPALCAPQEQNTVSRYCNQSHPRTLRAHFTAAPGSPDSNGVTASVVTAPDWPDLIAAIDKALGGVPAIRKAVADALFEFQANPARH
jgi:hypothetical protein